MEQSFDFVIYINLYIDVLALFVIYLFIFFCKIEECNNIFNVTIFSNNTFHGYNLCSCLLSSSTLANLTVWVFHSRLHRPVYQASHIVVTVSVTNCTWYLREHQKKKRCLPNHERIHFILFFLLFLLFLTTRLINPVKKISKFLHYFSKKATE